MANFKTFNEIKKYFGKLFDYVVTKKGLPLGSQLEFKAYEKEKEEYINDCEFVYYDMIHDGSGMMVYWKGMDWRTELLCRLLYFWFPDKKTEKHQKMLNIFNKYVTFEEIDKKNVHVNRGVREEGYGIRLEDIHCIEIKNSMPDKVCDALTAYRQALIYADKLKKSKNKCNIKKDENENYEDVLDLVK